MKLINQRDGAIQFLLNKLSTLVNRFEQECLTTYSDAQHLLYNLGTNNLQLHIQWLEYYNSHAPLLKWNSIYNYIELCYPNDDRVMKITNVEYAKLTVYLKEESLELARKKAYYLIEMLNSARSLDQLTLGGTLITLDPLIQNLIYLGDTIEKYNYLVYQLLPLYRDHIRLHYD